MDQVEEIKRQKTYYNFKVMAVTRGITEEHTRKYDLSIFLFSHSQLYENEWGKFDIGTVTKSRPSRVDDITTLLRKRHAQYMLK